MFLLRLAPLVEKKHRELPAPLSARFPLFAFDASAVAAVQCKYRNDVTTVSRDEMISSSEPVVAARHRKEHHAVFRPDYQVTRHA